MAAVAGVVLGAVVSAVTKNVVTLAFKLLQKRCELWKGFKTDIDFIRRELLMIAGAEEDQLSGKGDPRAVRRISMEEMHDLALDIEDCLDRILRFTEGEEEASLLHRIKAVGRRAGSPPFASEIQELKERLKAAHQRKRDYNVNDGHPNGMPRPTAPAIFSTSPVYTTKIEPVGIDKSKREILELLDDINGQPEQLNVISIVGLGGSGKSTLAKAVYDCPNVVDRFPCRAWVTASEHRGDADDKGILTAFLRELRQGDTAGGDVVLNLQANITNYLSATRGVLTALLRKLGLGDPATGDNIQNLQANITNYLSANRYLIVFDDIDGQQWDSIKWTFPEKMRGRIIVTTTVQAVGKDCSRGNGYVYNMETLDLNHSKDLLEAVLNGHPGLEQSSASILKKCDGHPLALISVATCLSRKGVLREEERAQFCRSLGYHMARDDYSFSKLRQVFMNNYSSLSSYLLKTSLLYICVFPNGCPIKRNSLTRRWLAEGYVQCQHPHTAVQVADENFNELSDRNIIRPIEPSKNAKVKTFKVHGIMHEFMLHMSTCAKFITSLDNPERSTYRHLFMENNSDSRALDANHNHTNPACVGTSENKKFRARSFTVCGSAGEDVAEYAKCELLRVLDLEECNDLKHDHMKDIHKLWHLKYLSLGATISTFPSRIEKLHCLETLDARKSKIDTLPVEVIRLPYLAHLLGKFKLEKRDWRASELHKFLPKESNMQTLAGFVTDCNSGFPMLMARMRKLRKVKIWCNPEDSKSLADLSTAIKKFVQDEMETGVGARSLSLHLGNSSGNVLHFLENSYGYLSSLKLHGAMSGQTQFAMSLRGLTELCLSSTNNLTSNELPNLRKLIHLEYLKLVKISLVGFIIRRQDFPKLLRFCLVQSPTLPTLEQGALPKLISLHLLCENLDGLSGIQIEWHRHIQEIGLDSMVNQETITTWEDAAKKHPKRPRVMFFRRIGPNETVSMVKYVATTRPTPDTDSSVMEEQHIPSVQSISVDELSSVLKHANVAGPSMASNKFPSVMNNVMPCSSSAMS